MKNHWWYRFSLLIILSFLAIFVAIPSIGNFPHENNYPIKSRINLGLDLQGGLYMILGINFPNVYRDEVIGYARKVIYTLKDNGIEARTGNINLENPDDPMHQIIIVNKNQFEEAKSKIKEFFPGHLRLTGEKDDTLTYALAKVIKTQIEEQSVSKSIEVIRNRIDEFGVSEPEIMSQGNDRIIVKLPGVRDIERAKALIGRTAKLEFKIVNDEVPLSKIQELLAKATAAGIVYKRGQAQGFANYLHDLNHFLAKDLPEGNILSFELPQMDADAEKMIPYLVSSTSSLSGDDLEDANVQIDPSNNTPYVSMTFKASGAKLFEELTASSIGKRLAIILDGNVQTAPVVNQRIAGGRAQITLGSSGGFNGLMRQAKDIAIVLRAGALPVALDFEEQRIVGPGLGTDSIASARLASIIGCMAVFIFILWYYKFSGLIALVTLVLNIIFIVAGLVILEATLTLPGLAGIALTVGMAVDANIIIYERIREELRRGMSNYRAVENGFSNAFWTVIDANITTALAGVCLLNFGTGPVRGFAVTLLLGILSSVYTSYFVSKLIFEFYMNKVEGKDLSI